MLTFKLRNHVWPSAARRTQLAAWMGGAFLLPSHIESLDVEQSDRRRRMSFNTT